MVKIILKPPLGLPLIATSKTSRREVAPSQPTAMKTPNPESGLGA
jgi:hypothetical protein